MNIPENSAYRVIESNGEARTAIREIIDSATQEVMIFDRTPTTLRDRDVGSPEIIDVMRKMLLGGKFRKIRVVLQEVQGIEGDLPRLVALLAQFGGQVVIHRAVGVARDLQDVMLVADAHSAWRKPVHSHPRSVVNLRDAAAVKPYLERFEEIWVNSELAVADRQSGL